MNWLAVILGIIIIILIYVLFKYFTVNSSTLVPTANLMSQPPSITNISSPTSARYAYGVWIYVNSWNTQAKKYIFNRLGNIGLYLDGNSPILRCDIAMQGSSIPNTILITDNFPIQKWTQVIVSIDTQYADCYLDGKLVVSRSLLTGSTMPAIPPDSSTAMTLGTNPNSSWTPLDISIMSFNRWTGPVDPQTAWNSYMEKSGTGSLTSAASSYGINLNILNNNVLQSSYKLY